MERLSILTNTKEDGNYIDSLFKEKGCTICYECICNKCINNVNHLCSEVAKESCLNCDECYIYGLDDDSLEKNYKTECDNYLITDKDAECNRTKIHLV